MNSQRTQGSRGRRPRTAATAVVAPRFNRAQAVRFLSQLESLVAQEIRLARAALPKAVTAFSASELADHTHLGHVISHWHDDRHFLDSAGRPRPLRLQGGPRSLATLIRRIYPSRSVTMVARALLKSGAVRRRGPWFECQSRHMVFPAGLDSYLSGLVPVLGLLKTCRRNMTVPGAHKLLQRAVTNARVPLRELPALYRSIDRRAQPLLEAIDAEMMRRELRAQAKEPLTQVGLSVEVFQFPQRSRSSRGKRRHHPKARTAG